MHLQHGEHKWKNSAPFHQDLMPKAHLTFLHFSYLALPFSRQVIFLPPSILCFSFIFCIILLILYSFHSSLFSNFPQTYNRLNGTNNSAPLLAVKFNLWLTIDISNLLLFYLCFSLLHALYVNFFGDEDTVMLWF